MCFKNSLDKYLTSVPYDDGYSDYIENLVESFSDDFFEANEIWIIEETEQFDNWANKLFYKHDYKTSAKIIERAFSLYKL